MENHLHIPGDNDAARYHYWAHFDGEDIVAVVRSANPDDRNSGERFDKSSCQWVSDRYILRTVVSSSSWSESSADEADAATLRESFGLNASPVGDPGFIIAIDVDTHSYDKFHASNDRPANSRVEQTHSGHVRVVVDAPYAGWFSAGSTAVDIARRIESRWPVACVQVCRADLWDDGEQAVQPVTTETRESVDARRETGHIVTYEVLPIWSRVGDFTTGEFPHSNSFASVSVGGRPQQNVVTGGCSIADTAMISSKLAHGVSDEYAIVRIRASRADYFADQFLETTPISDLPPVPASTPPLWSFTATIDGERFAVFDDPHFDYTGWSVEVEHNGETHLGSVTPRTLWRVGTEYNLCAMGEPVSGWAAPVTGGAILRAFLAPNGERIEVDTWTYMVEWLVESLLDQPVALIIDLGPNDYVSGEHDDEDVVCAQMQVMADNVFMVRRSRVVLGHLIFADYSTSSVELDTWYRGDHFDDCTDGYLFTKDPRLAAETVITWFRDNQRSDSEGIGCNYRYADVLIPEDPTLF